MISLIVACSKNGVIGKNNDLPWYIPEDLRRFKALTTGKTVIMGRKTYESIIARINKPLPNRRNIVISSTLADNAGGVEVVGTLDEALFKTKESEEIFIIGGASIYRECMQKDIVERMYITEVYIDIDGDVYFPEYDKNHWKVTEEESREADGYTYSFKTLTRVK